MKLVVLECVCPDLITFSLQSVCAHQWILLQTRQADGECVCRLGVTGVKLSAVCGELLSDTAKMCRWDYIWFCDAYW